MIYNTLDSALCVLITVKCVISLLHVFNCSKTIFAIVIILAEHNHVIQSLQSVFALEGV